MKFAKAALTLAFLGAALFYLLIVPIWAASDPAAVGPWGVAFAAFLFIQLWWLIAYQVLETASALYGFKKPNIFPGSIFLESPTSVVNARSAIEGMLLSYFFTVYAFGVAYIFISGLDREAFNTGQTLSYIDGLYFSVVTAATVGYGDIIPKSTAAKIMVMIEIVCSLLYVIFLFSIASTYVRELRARDQSTPEK